MRALLAVTILIIASVQCSGGIKLSGTVLCTFQDVEPLFAGTTNWFEAFLDDSDFLVRCGPIDDPAVDYFEYGSYEASSSYQLILYRSQPKQPGRDHKMTLTLFPSWQPERSMGFYIPVWLLIGGGKYFRSSGSGDIGIIGRVPFRVFHLGKKSKARWRLHDGFITDFVQYFNGEFYQDGSPGLVVEDASQLAGATNISFRALERTNFNGSRVPMKFEYRSYYATSKSSPPRLLQTVMGNVTAIGSSPLPKRDFNDLSGVRVNDERIAREGERLPTYSYFVTNGAVHSLDAIPAKSLSQLLAQHNEQERLDTNNIPPKRPRALLIALFVFVFSMLVVWLIARRKA